MIKTYLRKFSFLVILLLAPRAVFAAANPSNIPAVASVAAMEALGSASPQYGTVYVTSYFANGSQGGGAFVFVPGGTCSTDHGTIFCPTGGISGHWQRQLGSSISTTMFGSDPTGVTDSTASFDNAFLASQTLQLPIMDPAGIFKLNSTVTLQPGTNYYGTGIGGTVPGASGTVLDFSSASTSTPCLFMQLPNGTNTVVGASFYDVAVKCPGTFGIEENTIAGGFTDDNTTQDYLFNVTIKNVYVSGGTSAAIELSKCFHAYVNAWVENRYFSFGDGIVYEGCDASVMDGSRIFASNGNAAAVIEQNTFGNGDNLINMDIGAFDNGHPAVVLAARQDSISLSTIEGNSTGTYIQVGPTGFVHTIVNNTISGNGSAHWLATAGGPFVSLTATNNRSSASNGPLSWGSSSTVAFNSALDANITYANNSDNGAALPFNSVVSDSNVNGYQWYISPANSQTSLVADSCDVPLTASNSAFTFAGCIAGQYVAWYSNISNSGSVTGTVTTDVVAWCSGGTGTLNIRGDDGSHATTIQAASLSLTASPKQFKNAFGGTGTYSSGMIFMALQSGTCASPRIVSVGVNSN